MNLNVNILLMIISYQCFTMCASELTTSTTQLNQSSKTGLNIIYTMLYNIIYCY